MVVAPTHLRSTPAMTSWLLFGVAIASLIVGSFAVQWWLNAQRLVRAVDRIAPALLEAEEFFALIDLSGQDAHFLERHGPMLKTCEVLQRAETGKLDVSGHAGQPVASARWYRHADLLRAVTSATGHWAAGARPAAGRFVFAFEEDIGEGFSKGGGSLVRTRIAIVIIRDGQVITAYPSLAPNAGQPIRDLPPLSE